jgi:ferredoxin-NADP reductase
MARAAVLGRLTWRVGTVAAVRDETATARTIVLDVPGWPGHLPGQHVDVRLTAPDGYSAQRSYSIASASGQAAVPTVELTVQRLADGEVSPYLTQTLAVGYPLELRGPVGGWFVWDPTGPVGPAGPAGAAPVLLVAGGSGVVPLMAMIRARAATGNRAPFRLIYSVRDPGAAIYAGELADRERAGDGLAVTHVYTRSAPPGSPDPAGRISAAVIGSAGWAPELRPAVFVCGPTGFVETAADLLVGAGHDPRAIKTERFGPSGGQP